MVDTVQPLYAEPLTMQDVVEFARAGEPGPSRVLTDLGRTVGRRLADLCTVLNPSAVVVGGQIGAATGLVAKGIREQIDRYASPIAGAAVQVSVSTLGSSAEILGAIELSRLDSASAAPAAR
jgi:predicted NBD/HSP70 family sugar kinase